MHGNRSKTPSGDKYSKTMTWRYFRRMLPGVGCHAKGWVTECVCIQSRLRRYSADSLRSGSIRSLSRPACLAHSRHIGFAWERHGQWLLRMQSEIRPALAVVSSAKHSLDQSAVPPDSV